MSVIECAVCAWRATCSLKFNLQESEAHCKEFTKDVFLEQEKKASVTEKKDKDKPAK